MVPRPQALHQVVRTLKHHPIAALLGPRQCGKTTLARMIAEREPCTFFDLENPLDNRRLSAPMSVLEGLSGLVVVDEIQRKPGFFELLRVLVDRPDNRFVFSFWVPHLPISSKACPNLSPGASDS